MRVPSARYQTTVTQALLASEGVLRCISKQLNCYAPQGLSPLFSAHPGHSDVESAGHRASILLATRYMHSEYRWPIRIITSEESKGSVVKMARKTPTWSSTNQVICRCRHRTLPLYLNASFQLRSNHYFAFAMKALYPRVLSLDCVFSIHSDRAGRQVPSRVPRSADNSAIADR